MPRLTDKEIDDAIAEIDAVAGYDFADGYDEDEYDLPAGIRPMYAVLTMERTVREVSLEEWIKYFTASPRRMNVTNISGVIVSTTFLGVNVAAAGAPLWFESIVFGGGLDGFCQRYTTLEEATAGHQTIVTTIKEAFRDATKADTRHRVERTRRNNIVR